MRARRGVVSLAVVLALGGCTGAKGSDGIDEQGYVGGSGAVTVLAIGDRTDPVDLAGPLLAGGDFDLADHRGKVVLINIWGSWCAPCREEAQHLQGAWDELKDRDVQFLGINTKDDAEGAATAFERKFNITYPSLSDPDGSLQLVFRKTLPPRAIPSTIVLDRDGRVAASVIGSTTKGTFTGLVEDLLDEDES